MTCELIEKVEAVFTAANALKERCCTGKSPSTPAQCMVPAIFDVYQEVKGLLADADCEKMTESPGAPDPGEIGQCLDPDWLVRCEAWINGITCEPTEGECPRETCYQVTISNAVHRMFGASGGCSYSSSGYSLEWNGQSQQWDLTIGGVLCTTGSTDKTDPRGTYLFGAEGVVVALCDDESNDCPPETCWSVHVEAESGTTFSVVGGNCIYTTLDAIPGNEITLFWSDEDGRWIISMEIEGYVEWTGGPTTKQSPVGFYTKPTPSGFYSYNDLSVTGPCE